MKITQNYINKYRFATNILIESNVMFFPLNPVKIANKYNIIVISYEKFEKEGLGSQSDCLKISNDGFCFSKNNKYFIVYNDKITSKNRRRFTITHELAHILLGHIDNNGYKHNISQMESEANMLTSFLLAPITVAHMCDVNSEKEMGEIFGLSKETSKIIYNNYNILRLKREISKLEINNLYNYFSPFISEIFFRKHYKRINNL